MRRFNDCCLVRVRRYMRHRYAASQTAFRDATDDLSRLNVLGEMGTDFDSTHDKVVAGFLARLILSEEHSRDVRFYAYLTLFMVCGRPFSDITSVPPKFRIPEDLDLPFVLARAKKGIGGIAGFRTALCRALGL